MNTLRHLVFTFYIVIFAGIGAFSFDALFAQEPPKNFYHDVNKFGAPLLSGTQGTYAPVTDFLKYPIAFVLENLALPAWKSPDQGVVSAKNSTYKELASSFEDSTKGIHPLFQQPLNMFADSNNMMIASLGEGIGSFLPYLRSKEVVVHGYDTAYMLDALGEAAEDGNLNQRAYDTYTYLKHHVEAF